jgi:hypothetical protein
MEMSLLTKQQAADLMEVPVGWVNVMLELGALKSQEGLNGETLIDADEILEKRYVTPRFEATSLAHVRSMLKKLALDIQH